MTEAELKQSIAQGEQDAITLDFTKWSSFSRDRQTAQPTTDYGSRNAIEFYHAINVITQMRVGFA